MMMRDTYSTQQNCIDDEFLIKRQSKRNLPGNASSRHRTSPRPCLVLRWSIVGLLPHIVAKAMLRLLLDYSASFVVIQSATLRISQRSGAIRLIQSAIGAATMRVL